jgi:plasmid stabilization system protein ParE
VTLTLRPRAERDLSETYAWYEARSPGLGELFLRSAEACFARIERHSDLYPIADGRVRRGRLHRFPYSVYYLTREDRIDILAVYHARRRPRAFDL